MPKVSVIVTTYNRKEFLAETIRSILNQTFRDFELIVVDNYSNYDFFAHISSFNDTRIRAFQNQNKGIIAVNRNFGIKKAKGEYIAFCDDDDIWVENKLKEQVDVIENTKCDLVHTNMFLFRGETKHIIKETSNKKIDSLKDLIKQNQINTSSVLVKNSSYLFFPEDPNLIAVEDYALWLELFIKGLRFEFLPHALVYYRLSDLNISGNKNWSTKHLKEIYIYISVLLRHPELKVNSLMLRHILINLIKYFVKGKILLLKKKKYM